MLHSPLDYENCQRLRNQVFSQNHDSRSARTRFSSPFNPHPVRLYNCTGQDSLHLCSKYESYTSTAVPVQGYADGHAVLPAACG
jgi:hypothetical protein